MKRDVCYVLKKKSPVLPRDSIELSALVVFCEWSHDKLSSSSTSFLRS